MIKIPISTVWFTSNVDAGGGIFGKSSKTGQRNGLELWYLGHAVLIEQIGMPDRLVPIANVLTIEAPEGVSVEHWSGGTAYIVPKRTETPASKAAALLANPLATEAEHQEAAAVLVEAAVYKDKPKKGAARRQ